MMRIVCAAALALALASQAQAITGAFDANRDGVLSMEELLKVYPDLSADLFEEIDTDADGWINDDELLIALGMGVLQRAGQET